MAHQLSVDDAARMHAFDVAVAATAGWDRPEWGAAASGRCLVLTPGLSLRWSAATVTRWLADPASIAKP
jgi:hypothetical protein